MGDEHNQKKKKIGFAEVCLESTRQSSANVAPTIATAVSQCTSDGPAAF